MPNTSDRPAGPQYEPSDAATKTSTAGGDAADPAGRYDANLELIRRRLADEDRMKTRRRWKLL